MTNRPSYFNLIAPNFRNQPMAGAFRPAPQIKPDELYRVYSIGQRRERTLFFINRLKGCAPLTTRIAPFVSPFEIIPESITEVVPILYINSAGNILGALKGIQADYPDKQIQVYFDPELTHSAVNVSIQMSGVPIYSSTPSIKMKLQEVIDHYHFGTKLGWKTVDGERPHHIPLPRPIVLDLDYNPFLKRTRSESPRSMSPKAQEFQPKNLAVSV